MVDLSSNRVFTGQQSEVYFTDPLDTLPDSENIYDELDSSQGQFADFSSVVIDFQVSDPEASVSLQNTFGGQIMVQEPSDLVEIEFTMRFQDLDAYKEMHGEPDTITDSNSDEWTRYVGTKTAGDRDLRGILFRLKNGDDEVVYFLNNALYTQLFDVQQDAEGAAEATGMAVCRVGDRVVEQNF